MSYCLCQIHVSNSPKPNGVEELRKRIWDVLIIVQEEDKTAVLSMYNIDGDRRDDGEYELEKEKLFKGILKFQVA